MCTKSQIGMISDKIVERYREIYGKDIVKVVLYGSYAREDNDELSDVDIAAIVKGERLNLQDRLKDVWSVANQIGFENDVIISPVVIPFDEYEKYKGTLLYYTNIDREGKVIG